MEWGYIVFAVILYLFFIHPVMTGYKEGRYGNSSKPKTQSPNLGWQGEIDVVGESFYQGNLEALCGGKTKDGVEKQFVADLIPEDDNEHDKNAVRVDINGRTVGYLPREIAKKYRKSYADNAARCGATIVGGWKRRGGKSGHFGVRLNQSPETT
ncbi:MAG: HIRAN domain-containing protein [Burkholderiaceae bacterium]